MVTRTIQIFRDWFPRMALLMGFCALQSCGPGAPREEAAADATLELSRRLTPDVVVGEVLKNEFDLTWETHRRRDDIIRGYNVYVASDAYLSTLPADSPKLHASLYNAATYPGDTDGDIRTETIHIENVLSGTRYFVHVRTVFPDGTMGLPSPELEVVPRPRGQLTICTSVGDCDDGFSFRLDQAVEKYSDDNDIYVYLTKTDMFIASPSRLDRGLRRSLFVDIGPSGSLDDHPRLERDLNGDEKLMIREGRSFAVILTGNRIAKLRPLEIERAGDNPRVVFEYIYQPISGELTF
jgi:hypothetical protein